MLSWLGTSLSSKRDNSSTRRELLTVKAKSSIDGSTLRAKWSRLELREKASFQIVYSNMFSKRSFPFEKTPSKRGKRPRKTRWQHLFSFQTISGNAWVLFKRTISRENMSRLCYIHLWCEDLKSCLHH